MLGRSIGNIYKKMLGKLISLQRYLWGLPRVLWDQLLSLPENARQAMLLALDIVLVPTAIYISFVARLGVASTPEINSSLVVVAIVTTVITTISFMSLGLYRAVIRFMGNQAIISIIKGVTISALVLSLTAFLTHTWLPRSLPLIYWLIAIAFIGGSRLIVRAYYQKTIRRAGRLAIIYGAGDAGRNLMSAINHGQRYRTALFVDDDPKLLNRSVDGVPVKHPRHLPELINTTGARYVFLAMPSLSKDRRREIINSLVDLHVHVKTVPSMDEIFEGQSLTNIQEIDADDLLGRAPIPPDIDLMKSCVEGFNVLVTGAGGSIGSELVRQIALCEPRRLILLEQSEYSLYQIEQEILNYRKTHDGKYEVICLLASIQDKLRLARIFEAYEIDYIYHAAAYKHVPLVEHNMLEGLMNNVIGTLNLVKEAEKNKVKTFTLISTDKAVRPTNVMGASKRFAELILQAYATKDTKTRFCMVRFGNVLGSSGSVVPIFREQIRSGGPVTVTHKDVIRYFMTITEAAQLVLQASAMGQGGDVFLLDMGEPVRIVELAKRMIWLMGREVNSEENPDGEIEIQYTGLRPGEKLYEELLIGDNVTGTGNPMIMRAHEQSIALTDLTELLGHLERACESGACDLALEILCQAVPEYRLSVPLVDTIWSQEKLNASRADNIIEGEFG